MDLLKGGLYLVGAMILTACTLSMPKRQQTKNILPPPCLERSVSDSLNSPSFAIGEWPQDCWWETFDDPLLNELIGEALAQNPSIQEAKRRIEVARQEAIIVRSKLFPLIFFEGQDIEQYLSSNGLYRALNPKVPLDATLVDLTLGFNYEFDFWGKNANLFRSSIGRIRVERAEASQVRLIITTAIAQSYFALKANLLRRALFEELLNIRKQELDLYRFLKSTALSSQLEPLKAEENLLEAQKLIDSIDAEIASDKHLVNILAGKNPDNCLQIDPSLAPLENAIAIPCNLSSDLLARRPDLMAQIWRAKALAYEVGASIADYYPDVNLSAMVGLETVSFGTLFQLNKSFTAGMTPSVYLPIFTAGAISANVRAHRAAFDEAIFAYNRLLLASAQEVADLLYLAKSIYKQKNEQNRIVISAKKRYKLVHVRSKSGLNNKLDEYAILEDLVQKELVDVTLTYSQYLASIKLIKALGGGYYSECIPLRACE